MGQGSESIRKHADGYKRRRKADRYDDFRMLPADSDDEIVFFGGKDFQHDSGDVGHRASSQAPPTFMTSAKNVAARAKLDSAAGHLHRFRDTAATPCLRVGIDVRTVQAWLGHELLATTQKYLEPSKETEKQLGKMKLPFWKTPMSKTTAE